MDYNDHKKHFEIAYKTGSDIWTRQTVELQGEVLIEKLAPDSLVLDIGSGRGFFAKHLAKIGFRVIGLDFEKNVVSKANADIKDWGMEGKLKFVEGEATDIPFTDASFDAVFDYGLFETLHKEDWGAYASEIARILKPGGLYLNASLSDKTHHFFEFSPLAQPEKDFEKYGIHYHFFNKEEMQNIFKNFETLSQKIEFTEKPREVAILETLFKKK